MGDHKDLMNTYLMCKKMLYLIDSSIDSTANRTGFVIFHPFSNAVAVKDVFAA